MLRVLRESLSGEPDLRIVGEAGTLERALTLASQVRPDVVVVDAEIPGLDAARAISSIGDEAPASAIVVISIEPDRLSGVLRGRERVLAIGKIEGADALLSAIRELGTTQG